jgi:endopolyphosphatase
MSLNTLLLACLAATRVLAWPQPSTNEYDENQGVILSKSKELSARTLKGKFLHITDIHPDPFYKVYSSTDEESVCHRHKGPAGYYGAETSACDSPLSLVNATFDWLKTHLRDEIDFVIWTGDSARHDNDENIPRTDAGVLQQNQFVMEKFLEAFGDAETGGTVIPIIPTLGNNDILPHNIFEAGPNHWTSRYLTLWHKFVPEAQRHQFARGGWFSVEVIPNKLAVFSLNTLYFFASNSAIDGCGGKSEPGYEQFEWLRVQLELIRARGMKAIMMGHVPPARKKAAGKNTRYGCKSTATSLSVDYMDT